MSSTAIVAYLVLFVAVGFAFLFAALVFGWFLRAKAPTPEKQEIYECGEPTIGSGFVQFDLRFYVVALLFIIFDVEVAFFFPWASVFGKSTQLMEMNGRIESADTETVPTDWIDAATRKYGELGVEHPQLDPDPKQNARLNQADASRLALAAMADMGVFFAVLLVGFAYVWSQGDLDWVRAVRQHPSEATGHTEPTFFDAATSRGILR